MGHSKEARAFDVLEELQELCKAEKYQEKQVKVRDDADKFNERIDHETGAFDISNTEHYTTGKCSSLSPFLSLFLQL